MMNASRVRVLTPQQAIASATPIFHSLEESWATVVAGYWTQDECRAAAQRVYEARDYWTPAFDGVQFSLGRAWYTHLERNRTELYFRRAAHSDEVVERFLPSMQRRVLEAFHTFFRQPVIKRRDWCGPGVHIFPAGEWLSQNGGEVHFDTEGLAPGHIADRAPAITLILMVQPPIAGGGLRLWDILYEGEDEVAAQRLETTESFDLAYGVGDLVAIDSYRLHQIQPFAGETDRISVTAHAVFDGDRWETWF
jgi:hypothetical protein